MKPASNMSPAGRAYVAAIACAGITAVGHSILALSSGQLGFQWFVLAGLTLLSGSFTVRVPTIPARLSVSETFVFAAAMLFGPAAATVLVVLDSLVISLWQSRSSRRPLRVLFNLSAPAVAIWVSAHVFFISAGIPPLNQAPRPVLSLLVPLLAMAVVYFLLNSWLIAGAVAFETRTSALRLWRQSFLWLSLNFFSGASVAALLLPYLQDPEQSFFRVAGILLPLLLISYLTFKTALGRVDDANKHLDELNQLYLSTIETLAMAIDAKDQITHGHIRRVQHYAVGLAKRVGVTEQAQISAIEAASLLHDMGKLAVPEYILNKPGKLTPAEFDRMKLHASVGADILSAIKFPYPVVPIVRHHHENWDGTGYPDGLTGSAIPIGARILSVVDCFDALTSDRPYRPRLSDGEAVRILMQRRGTMYDPLVVDAFIGAYAEIARMNDDREPRPAERLARPSIEDPSPLYPDPLENIAASSEEMLVLYDLARSLTGLRPESVIQVMFGHLRRIIPISVCVFYEYDALADILTATLVAGDNAHSFSGITIPRGQRLSGWVAANKLTILNSDPVLDLGDVARSCKPRLRSCLSTPVLSADRLVGVLTAYSVHDEPFGEDHRRVFESASRQIVSVLDPEIATRRLSVVVPGPDLMIKALPDEKDLRQLLGDLAPTRTLAVIFVELRHDRTVSGSAMENHLIAVAEVVRRHVPDPDMVFRYGPTGLLVALLEVDTAQSSQIKGQISKSLESSEAGQEWRKTGRITVGFAAAPHDGVTLDTLLASARVQQSFVEPPSRPPSVH
jgi:putative nucleotidyltransferase with HDIG domain